MPDYCRADELVVITEIIYHQCQVGLVSSDAPSNKRNGYAFYISCFRDNRNQASSASVQYVIKHSSDDPNTMDILRRPVCLDSCNIAGITIDTI